MEKSNSTTIKFAYEGKNYELGYTREKILKNLGNKEHLFAVLVEMFSEPIEFLGEPEKNAIEWTV